MSAQKKEEKSVFTAKPKTQRGTGHMRRQESGRTYAMRERIRRNGGRICCEKTDTTGGVSIKYVMHTGDHGQWLKA